LPAVPAPDGCHAHAPHRDLAGRSVRHGQSVWGHSSRVRRSSVRGAALGTDDSAHADQGPLQRLLLFLCGEDHHERCQLGRKRHFVWGAGAVPTGGCRRCRRYFFCCHLVILFVFLFGVVVVLVVVRHRSAGVSGSGGGGGRGQWRRRGSGLALVWRLVLVVPSTGLVSGGCRRKLSAAASAVPPFPVASTCCQQCFPEKKKYRGRRMCKEQHWRWW